MNIHNKVTKPQIARYPVYLNYLTELASKGEIFISSPKISKDLGYSEEQIRKDLQVISKGKGKPFSGRKISTLIKDLEDFLGYNAKTNAIIIGVGHLGQAFLLYKGFAEYGLNIVGGFDNNINIINKEINQKKIYSIENIEEILPTLDVEIAILTVPSEIAQEIALKVVNSGIKAIWNFVPIHLDLPDDIVIENVNLASSLAILSHKLKG